MIFVSFDDIELKTSLDTVPSCKSTGDMYISMKTCFSKYFITSPSKIFSLLIDCDHYSEIKDTRASEQETQNKDVAVNLLLRDFFLQNKHQVGQLYRHDVLKLLRLVF